MNSIATTPYSRRAFLKTSSILISLPFLESVASAQQLKSTAPKKLVFLGGGFGFTKESFFPSLAGKFAKIGLTQGLKPLEKHKNDLTFVSNLYNPKVTDPHAGSAGYLAGSKQKITCDQVAARKIGTLSRYPSLVLTTTAREGGHGSGGCLLYTSDAADD